jgi:regulator of sigma E protease
MSYLFAILGLGVLIVVHELGHMMVAKSFGMRVDRFSVGFGPALLRWYGRGTTYQVALVPLGGFVQIAGMNPHEELPEGDPGSYANKPVHARFLTILAGPLINYLFAIVIMSGVFLTMGYPAWEYLKKISVLPDSPAEVGGMKAGDIIEDIDGEPAPTFLHVLKSVGKSQGRELVITVLRDGKKAKVKVTPEKKGASYKIGISVSKKLSFSPLEPGNAVMLGLYYPVSKSQEALANLGKVFSGKVSTDQLGGPLEIVRQLKMSFEEGLIMAILFLGMLNVYLGLFNLLPLPALDGGRLVFLLFTMVSRKPVNQRVENTVHTIGFVILLGLILLLSFQDVGRY